MTDEVSEPTIRRIIRDILQRLQKFSIAGFEFLDAFGFVAHWGFLP